MKINRLPVRYLFFFAVVLLLLLLGVFLTGKNFIRDAIVIPAEYLFWLAGLAISVVPQYIFLAILVSMSILLALRSLLVENKRPPVSNPPVPARTRSERVAFWTYQLGMAGRGGYSRFRFAEVFGKLILDVLTYNGQIEPDNDTGFAGNLDEGNLDVPPEIRKFLKMRLAQITEIRSPGIFARLRNGIGRWLRFLTGRLNNEVKQKSEESQADQDLLTALGYLEHELEVNDKQNGN